METARQRYVQLRGEILAFYKRWPADSLGEALEELVAAHAAMLAEEGRLIEAAREAREPASLRVRARYRPLEFGPPPPAPRLGRECVCTHSWMEHSDLDQHACRQDCGCDHFRAKEVRFPYGPSTHGPCVDCGGRIEDHREDRIGNVRCAGYVAPGDEDSACGACGHAPHFPGGCLHRNDPDAVAERGMYFGSYCGCASDSLGERITEQRVSFSPWDEEEMPSDRKIAEVLRQPSWWRRLLGWW